MWHSIFVFNNLNISFSLASVALSSTAAECRPVRNQVLTRQTSDWVLGTYSYPDIILVITNNHNGPKRLPYLSSPFKIWVVDSL